MTNMQKIQILILCYFLAVSCSENAFSPSSDLDIILSLRSDPCEWCDGGCSNPPAASIISATEINGECCIEFRTVVNAEITLSTSNYNFNLGTGSPTGSVYEETSDSGGYVPICFDQIGTHFRLEVNTSSYSGCTVFENQC